MRIVSLVPSLTETLWELGVGPSLVGVTKFCVHPPQAREQAAVVGGTKDPDVERIRRLQPDLVIADEDENQAEHLEALRAVARVHVTRIQDVADAARELSEIGRLVGREHDAEARAQQIQARAAELRSAASLFAALRIFVPIWRTPLMTIGRNTYMGDLVRLAGGRSVFENAPRKYFETTFDEVRAVEPEGVLLPTEPFHFGEKHRSEFAQALDLSLDRVLVVDGQAFTWFGTRTLEGLECLREAVVRLRTGAAGRKPQPQTP